MNQPKLSITDASKADVSCFQKIFLDTWKNVYSKRYAPELIEAVIANDNTTEAWLSSIDQGYRYFKVSDGSNECLAMAGLLTNEVGRVGVLTSRAGQGTGKFLMQHVFEKAMAANHRFVWCDASLQAIDFYTKVGFTSIKKIEKIVYGQNMPMETMVKVLKSKCGTGD